MARLIVNGQAHQLEVDPDTPLLWGLREQTHVCRCGTPPRVRAAIRQVGRPG